MVKPNSRYASEAQTGAQELLRQLLMASASHDFIEGLGGTEKLGKASLVQQATADKAAIKRCIEILTAANSDDECVEAIRLVGSILDSVEQPQPLQ
jgi:hypothetical protein